MNDTVKLIIEIPKEDYEFTKGAKTARVFPSEYYVKLILNGIPLDENKGDWIESKERSKHWYCSVCGGIHTDPETGKWRETFDYRYPFCPNCGADMRG